MSVTRENMHGHSIIELLVTMGLAGILLGIAVADTRQMLFPGNSSSSLQLASHLKTVRRRAINSTLAHTVKSISSIEVETTTGLDCDAPIQTVDPQGSFKLTNNSSFVGTWNVCFNSRGYADSNITIPITQADGTVKQVEVLLGGFVRVLQ